MPSSLSQTCAIFLTLLNPKRSCTPRANFWLFKRQYQHLDYSTVMDSQSPPKYRLNFSSPSTYPKRLEIAVNERDYIVDFFSTSRSLKISNFSILTPNFGSTPVFAPNIMKNSPIASLSSVLFIHIYKYKYYE